jgi:hypothetical protein
LAPFNTAGDQALRLGVQRVLQRIVGHIAQARQLGSRPDRANHVAGAAIGKTFRRFARQFAGDFVDLKSPVFQLELAQRDRRAAKAVGLHHVRAGGVIAPMDIPHQIRSRQVQHFRAVFLVPIVLLDIQRQGLNARAHPPIAKQDGFGESFEQMRLGHPCQIHRIVPMSRQ